ncbi:hypothetical protein [Parabacteroides pacaensis]|uniref:hypothetical protein n=1 Tax=Parabacteroides pacaensis TaxID=2086575 RepID=UPI000D0F37EE
MKVILIFFVLFLVISNAATAQLKIGGKKINTGKLIDAGTDTIKVVMLTDADSTRPDSEERSACIKQKADEYTQTQQ